MLHILCSSNLRLWDSSTLSHFFSTTFATFGTVILYELSFFHWSACPIWSTRFYPHFSFNLEVAMFLAVVCFKGSRAKHLPRPPFLGPTRCYAHKFSLFLMKNVSSTHIMCDKADQKQLFCIQRPPNRNCYMQVLCFQRGPKQQLQFEGNLFSKGPPTAIEMCKCSAFKLHWRGPSKKL